MPVLDAFSLKGKVALLVGNHPGSTAILGQALAEAGARVFVAASTRECLDKSIATVKEQGDTGLGVVIDTTREQDVLTVLDMLDSRMDRLDILVNNNQVEYAKPFLEVSTEEWDTLMARNLRSTFLFCREAGKRMVSQRHGRIINIISGLAERGLWNSAAYCATQGAVLQLTRALALEWARHNVRVNAIGTGWYSLEEQPREEAEKDRLVRYVPLRRKGHPRDIAPLLAYLASDACDYTTGSAIYVDGGLMAHA